MNKLTIDEIKKELLNDPNVDFLKDLKNDQRLGVIKLLKSYQQRKVALKKQQEHYLNSSQFEKPYWNKGQLVAGIDEVGRGCLAGPVVCAAVILDPAKPIYRINDSKQLSSKARLEIAQKIKDLAIDISISVISVDLIDRINILEASRFGMHEAVVKLAKRPDHLLIDALQIDSDIEQESFIKGDFRSVSIGAASIIAKVYRDQLMDQYADFYPEYNFEHNKGYGTKDHLQALKQWGVTPIHRLSYEPVKKVLKNS